MWLDPKTDWTRDGYMNYSDWERITGNLQHIKNVYYIPGRWRPMTIAGGKNGYPTVEIVNNLEENLTLIRNYLRNKASEPFAPVEWFAKLDPRYIRNPNWNDFNRWEQLTADMYMILKGMLVSGTFWSGDDRTVQKLSRGRIINRRNQNARRNFR